jgi:hypothetical protein
VRKRHDQYCPIARGADRDTPRLARRGEATLADAPATGAATASGGKRALRNFQRIYRLP